MNFKLILTAYNNNKTFNINMMSMDTAFDKAVLEPRQRQLANPPHSCIKVANVPLLLVGVQHQTSIIGSNKNKYNNGVRCSTNIIS